MHPNEHTRHSTRYLRGIIIISLWRRGKTQEALKPEFKPSLWRLISIRVGFPGSPMIKTLPFQCRGYGFSPWLGNQDATGCVAQTIKKIKINIFQATLSFRNFLHPLQGKSHILLWRSSFWSSFKELLTTTGLFTFYHEFTHPLYFSFTPSLARS